MIATATRVLSMQSNCLLVLCNYLWNTTGTVIGPSAMPCQRQKNSFDFRTTVYLLHPICVYSENLW